MTHVDTAGPTLDDIRSWPAAVSVPRAAAALGISRSVSYELVRRSEFPVRTIRAGGRYVVVTDDLIRVLSSSDRSSSAPTP